ncbi:hypothetical protein ABENE_06865 [Asticcacaulis benevestitus DSM 16100 = ATCC BAA-896]|uniref:Uncharacterized protein n=1 Tax=Asticcacaulis benevestitus DSM 16100 = ATCC BAA-896 TaxID=1121022 RepID=V4PFQ9_9CAUL|nr:hypothetical protein ABENE_06865 [Asticcacaulis benevestitus DSM 16100 = ATCC BAA-896]
MEKRDVAAINLVKKVYSRFQVEVTLPGFTKCRLALICAFKKTVLRTILLSSPATQG